MPTLLVARGLIRKLLSAQLRPYCRQSCTEIAGEPYRIAHNIAIRSTSRTRTRNAREPLLALPFDPPSADASAEEALMVNERRQALMDRIRGLSILDRQVVTLHLEGLSAAEIEEVTGVSQAAVATRLTRIRQKLAEKLRAEGAES